MNKNHIQIRKNSPAAYFSSLFALLLTFSNYSAALPMVEVEAVQSWSDGLIDELNCNVDTPFQIKFSSDSDARLIFILPAGSQVKKDQLIARQEDYYLTNEIERLSYQQASAKLAAEFNEQEYQRLSALAASLISPSQLNTFALKRAEAKLNQQVLTKMIEQTRHKITKLKHYAPDDGEIVSLDVSPGESINEGQSLLTFLPQKNKEIKCELALSRFIQSDNLSQSQFQLSTGENLSLKRISKIADINSQSIALYLDVPEAAATLLIGQRLKIAMKTQFDNIIRLPLDGINLHRDGNFVWRVSKNGEIDKVSIQIVANQSHYFLVTSQLKAGDNVITLGKNGLEDNQKVNYIDQTANADRGSNQDKAGNNSAHVIAQSTKK